MYVSIPAVLYTIMSIVYVALLTGGADGVLGLARNGRVFLDDALAVLCGDLWLRRDEDLLEDRN